MAKHSSFTIFWTNSKALTFSTYVGTSTESKQVMGRDATYSRLFGRKMRHIWQSSLSGMPWAYEGRIQARTIFRARRSDLIHAYVLATDRGCKILSLALMWLWVFSCLWWHYFSSPKRKNTLVHCTKVNFIVLIKLAKALRHLQNI